VRTVVCRYEDLAALRRALHAEEPELVASEPIEDGEWVLVVIEVGPSSPRRATALAARGVTHPDQEGGRATLVFEPRDWEVLRRFAVTIPPGAPDSTRPPITDRSPQSRPSRKMKVQKSKVLVVDDDPDLREVVGAMLEAVGLAVKTVGSAEEAIACVKSERFDLMVLDWTLPGRSGLELCREVRAIPRVGGIPMLFLTANASPSDMVEAFASGADDYVVKPFRAPELGARIFGLLRRSRPPEGG
jgi:two-component system phosphate regulon response regulator PhoB